MQLLSKVKSRLCSRTSKCSAWGSLLTVFTTSFWPSRSRKRGGYTTSFMHVFNTNKVPRVVLVFLLAGTHFGNKKESPSHTRQVWPALLVRLDQHPATIRVPVITTSTNTLWMDRIRRGYVGLIQRVWKEALGSTGPLLPHASNHHSEAILSILYQWWCITWFWVDTAGSRGTAAPTKRGIRRNWPKIPTHNWPRSKHQDCPWWKAAHYRCGRTWRCDRACLPPP
jgi:hypothetical protein